MDKESKFAEEYTKNERIRFVIIYGIPAALFILTADWWFFPWIEWFASTSHCHEFLGVAGDEWLLYGLFVGMPSILLIPSIYLCYLSRSIIVSKQLPPPGKKVLTKTRIIHGRKAVMRGYLNFSSLIIVFSFMTWGYFTASDLLSGTDSSMYDYSICGVSNTK